MSGTFDDGATAVPTYRDGAIRYVGSRERGDVFVTTHPDGERLTSERSLKIVRHSPSGFAVGYRGSGPAQLALAILLDYTDNAALAREHYQTFTDEVVNQLEYGDDGTWTITEADIEQVLPNDIAPTP
ncbi:hypothetical protein EFA46_015285 (plasmid) [Halarchaeum sp. CBA1220]|uniref:DUF6166 domain-containing protein n=1 Tax=Halarchaeum sp. CBA1220 TaxID=1853682 RepID=UPI000F3A9BE2|nr:DUF6166 domain-containing protein [Halarchaeum sp. CBA1220]QLC35590.1 hypothetical protein EFA46_015285 [Halarchaeum sp. CBA1220]